MITNKMKDEKSEIGIRLLTLDGCDYCDWLKSELDAEGIAYVNIDAYQFNDFSDEVEEKFKTDRYPITFIDLGHKVVTIVGETSLDTTDTLRTFTTIPHLVSIIKSYIK